MGVKSMEPLKDDNRHKTWAEIETDIQLRASKKDKSFVLSGKWKKFIRNQEGFKVYMVNGEWVRNNLSMAFGHGGHGYVHEFIPLNEVWLGSHHFKGCGCGGIRKDMKLSQAYFDSTTIHEITEFREMKKGVIFWEAHQLALKKEIEAKLIPNPYQERYD